ncbi:MAG: Alpha-amylase 1 [Deltaproteobacteria bacterium ADurb.Bin510]|nr:MAG: Alpha-amylase 1 [Deltaproteobacteria bacterium ADurb.Bin510]
MADYAAERFGERPTGLWCAERIWEPGLPKKLAGLGIDYTLLDDSHFLAAGLTPEQVHGYYLTEREGYALKVFPIDMHLRYMIPFREPWETIDYLRRLRDRGVKIATYGDDGEKFGMWPGTCKWVYEEGWLERFMTEIEKVGDEIEVVPLRDAARAVKPQGRIYLPTATYQEMMEWSLFAESGRIYEDLINRAKEEPDWQQQRAFLRGGLWDNFLAKYPESNLMHKKMLRVSGLVASAGAPATAERHLLMGQCNCPYWHGLFGGVYIRGLRHAIYEHLITAERLTDEARFADGQEFIFETCDQDYDGLDEILVSGRKLNCYLAPHAGASVYALEYKPLGYALSNILMRHPEIYHRQILENSGGHGESSGNEPKSIHDIDRGDTTWLKSLLIYDEYPKNSFMTHLLTEKPDLELLARDNRVLGAAALDYSASHSGDSLSFSAACAGLKVVKTFDFKPDAVSLSHWIESATPLWLVLEFNLMILSGERPRVAGRLMDEDRGIFSAATIELADTYKGLSLTLTSAERWEVVVTPIECASQSESGFEKTFQGWTIYLVGRFERVPAVELKVVG